MDERLRLVQDQCPIGNGFPSVRHTRWRERFAGYYRPTVAVADGYTSTVTENFLFSWQQSHTRTAPTVQSTRSWLVLQEWIPPARPLRMHGWLRFGTCVVQAIAPVHARYRDDWRPRAARNLKTFLRSSCDLRLGTPADLEELYRVSQVPKGLQKMFVVMLDRHLTVHPEDVEILVAEKDGKPVACLIAAYCDEIGESEYLIGAFHPDYAVCNTMVGLVDWWYQRLLARGYTTANYGSIDTFRQLPFTGATGYSVFKTQFGVRRVWFPGSYWRLSLNV